MICGKSPKQKIMEHQSHNTLIRWDIKHIEHYQRWQCKNIVQVEPLEIFGVVHGKKVSHKVTCGFLETVL